MPGDIIFYDMNCGIIFANFIQRLGCLSKIISK